MDDGTVIKLTVDINENGTALFDFTGSGPQVHIISNLNIYHFIISG